jgi:hypothetical protein
LVVERVQDDLEAILFSSGKVLPDVVDDDSRTAAVVTDGCDVEVLAVERHPDLGVFRRGLALVRLGLNEAGHRRRQAPGGIVEYAVDDHRVSRLDGENLQAPALRPGGERPRLDRSFVGRRRLGRCQEREEDGPHVTSRRRRWPRPLSASRDR